MIRVHGGFANLSGMLDLASELGSTALSLAKGPGFDDIEPTIFRAVLDGYVAAGGALPGGHGGGRCGHCVRDGGRGSYVERAPATDRHRGQDTVVQQSATKLVFRVQAGSAQPVSYLYQLNQEPRQVVAATNGRASVKVFPDRFTNVVSVSSRAADGSLSVDETVLFLNASWPPPSPTAPRSPCSSAANSSGGHRRPRS
jgi:hypothetical protein